MPSVRPRPPIVVVRHPPRPETSARPVTRHTPFLFNVIPTDPEPSTLARVCSAAGAYVVSLLRWAGLVEKAPAASAEHEDPS